MIYVTFRYSQESCDTLFIETGNREDCHEWQFEAIDPMKISRTARQGYLSLPVDTQRPEGYLDDEVRVIRDRLDAEIMFSTTENEDRHLMWDRILSDQEDESERP